MLYIENFFLNTTYRQFSLCGIEILYLSGIDEHIFVYIAYGKIVCISYGPLFSLYYV